MVTWGDADCLGDSTAVQDQLYMVAFVCGTSRAFLELRSNGTFFLGDDASWWGKCAASQIATEF